MCKVGPELSPGRRLPARLRRSDMRQGVRRGMLAGSGGRDALRGRLAVHRPRPASRAARSARTMCRNDADCPSKRALPGAPDARALADGRRAMIGMCTPESKIVGTVACARRMCPPGQGCVLYGARTSLRICRAGGTKSLGTACAAASECRSGECYDRDFHVDGGQNRAYCSGRLQRQQRLRPRSGLRAAGRRQQRHRAAIRSTIWWSATAARCSCRWRATGCGTDTAVRRAPGRLGHAATSRTASAIARRPRPVGLHAATTDCPLGGDCSSARASQAATARHRLRSGRDVGRERLPGNEQRLRAARRSRRADLGLLRECVPSRRRLQPRQPGLRVRIGDAERAAKHLPGGQRDVSPCVEADRDAGCGSGRVERVRRWPSRPCRPLAPAPPRAAVANAPQPAARAGAGPAARCAGAARRHRAGGARSRGPDSDRRRDARGVGSRRGGRPRRHRGPPLRSRAAAAHAARRARLPGGQRRHGRMRGDDGRARRALLVDPQPGAQRRRRVRRRRRAGRRRRAATPISASARSWG